MQVASFHGTSTTANDKNESDVVNQQMEHLGRAAGNPVFVVAQKWLTGHPKVCKTRSVYQLYCAQPPSLTANGRPHTHSRVFRAKVAQSPMFTAQLSIGLLTRSAHSGDMSRQRSVHSKLGRHIPVACHFFNVLSSQSLLEARLDSS